MLVAYESHNNRDLEGLSNVAYCLGTAGFLTVNRGIIGTSTMDNEALSLVICGYALKAFYL